MYVNRNNNFGTIGILFLRKSFFFFQHCKHIQESSCYISCFFFRNRQEIFSASFDVEISQRNMGGALIFFFLLQALSWGCKKNPEREIVGWKDAKLFSKGLSMQPSSSETQHLGPNMQTCSLKKCDRFNEGENLRHWIAIFKKFDTISNLWKSKIF